MSAKLDAAVGRLADAVDGGHLLAAMGGGAGLLTEAAEELERLHKFEASVCLALVTARVKRAGAPGIEHLASEVERLTLELADEKAAHADERAAREHTWETLGKRVAEVAERTRERDDARRWFCEEVAHRRRSKGVREGNGDTVESVAKNLGWGYLYETTEEPKP